MPNLTKRELVIRISNETGMVQAGVLNIVQKTLDYITEAIAEGQSVELRNFGVFSPRVMKSRVGRNPNKPESGIVIPEKYKAMFQEGKSLKEKVRSLTNALCLLTQK